MDEIIEIDDYEVKDKQIIETDEDEDSQGQYGNQGDYGNGGYGGQYREDGNSRGFYKSISLNNTSLLIILMVVIVLLAIFVMTFD